MKMVSYLNLVNDDDMQFILHFLHYYSGSFQYYCISSLIHLLEFVLKSATSPLSIH